MSSSIETSALSVSELTSKIRSLLEPSFAKVTVRGEISNLKIQTSGHAYFTLKDEGAQISAALFQGYLRQLPRMPKEGDKVTLIADLNVYAPRGQYQLIVKTLSYDGVGELLLKLHALKLELASLGFFEKERKKTLPRFPRRIGVITSPTGAVIQDIIHILRRRVSSFHLILNPVRVQGELAASEIAQAIDQCNKHDLADVLIVGRGGGSLEDLWPFNERCVAEAIFRSKIPIISAVGHETDFSIADFVADVRAPTPSAAAEMVSYDKKEMSTACLKIAQHLVAFAQRAVAIGKQRLFALDNRWAVLRQNLLLPYWQRLDDTSDILHSSFKEKLTRFRYRIEQLHKVSLCYNPASLLEERKKKLFSLEDALMNAFSQNMARQKERLAALKAHLMAIDPKQLVANGYAIAFNENGEAITRAKDLHIDQRLSLLFGDGKVRIQVLNKELSHESG